jgi:hypothetical protein
MKFILIIFSTIMINACGGSKDLASNTNDNHNSMTQEKSEMINTIQMLEYTANSRGSHILVRITEQFINYKLNRNDELIAIPNTKENWDELMMLVSKVDIETIPNLEAPSKAHQYDGAAHANFTVYKEKGTNELQTPTFDAGNPNKAIAPVIEKMMSLIPAKS